MFSVLRGAAGAGKRRIASGLSLSLVAGALVAAAVTAEGVPISEVDLNDGGVWVSKDDDRIIARLNSQVKELDLGVPTAGSHSVLNQDAVDVQLIDLGGGGDRRVEIVDVVNGKLTAKVDVSKGVEISSARRTVAFVDRQSGKGWVRHTQALAGFTTKADPTVTGLGQKASVVVGSDGTAHFLSRSKSAVTPVTLDASGVPVVGKAVELKGQVGDQVEMTAVGSVPVVLDRAKSTVFVPGASPVAVEGNSPILQQPQAHQSGEYYVATQHGLLKGSLSGGSLKRVSTIKVDGTPAAPVVVDGCAYGAWRDLGASENFEVVCGTESADSAKIPQMSGSARLVFRVNRKVVVLNDASGGMAWLVQSGMHVVNNWKSVDPRQNKREEVLEEDRKPDPNRNYPPVAKDDDIFGARAGTTVVLPVTVNDNDPDGDVLTVSPNLRSRDKNLELTVVGNGTQVQAKIPANASGSVSFTYTVTDGHPDNPESNEAQVTLNIVDQTRDAKPEMLERRVNELTVAKGHQASLNVMPAWYDPDGDPLVLTNAYSEGGEVHYRPDGRIEFRDNGQGGSRKTIHFDIAGGKAVAKGKVAVTVVAPDKAAPVTVADRVSGIAGSAISLDPLANDTDPLGGDLRLVRLDAKPVSQGQIDITRDAESGNASVTAQRPGSYYLTYVAGNNSSRQSKKEVIRVDVMATGTSNRPPTADRDIAAVGPTGSTLVDVLANDSDPDGDVLIVRGFGKVPDGIKASLIDQKFVRVEALAPLDGRTAEVVYHLTDGEHQVEGVISITEADATGNRPPVAVDDQVTARAGSIITIPVLANDSDPDADPLTVFGQDLDLPKDVPVVATGNAVRVMVPDDGRPELEFMYMARDSSHAGGTARVVVNILPNGPKGNRAPQPKPVEWRAVSGQIVKIPLAAIDADPDGDPVSFSRVVEQPTLGRVVNSGVDWIEYEANPEAVGTDSFSVQIADQFGATGRLDIRVGVAQKEPVNQRPAALDDTVFVKPGRTIQVPVLANDSDPDGDELILLPKISSMDDSAKVVDGFIEVTSPRVQNGGQKSTAVNYSVTDGLGGFSRALLVVTASDNAPNHAPMANDDVVLASDIAGKKAGDKHDVDVLANDGDLDGAPEALKIEALTDDSREARGKLRVTLSADDRVVPYRLVDADGEVAYGFVRLTGTDNMAPELDESKLPIKVEAGEKLQIDLRDYVLVRKSRQPRIYRHDQVSVVRGDGTDPVVDDQTLVYRSTKDFYGMAAVLLPVTDGKSVDDGDGLVSQITIPIEVTPAKNVAPEVRSTSVQVTAGADPVSIDLERIAKDANIDKLSFKVRGAQRGVKGKIHGNELLISADKDAPSTDEMALTLEADDGKVKKPSEGKILVRVYSVEGKKKSIGADADELVDDEVEPDALARMTLMSPVKLDGAAGKTVAVDMAAQIVFDPNPKLNKKITGIKRVEGRGDAKTKGMTVQVTPDTDFAGRLTYEVTIDDGTGDPARAVKGRVEVTVAAVPDAPGKPLAEPQTPTSMRLSWAAPADNGKPITSYQVKWKGGKQECRGTQCVINGLKPGDTYEFIVTARNEIGESKPSPASDPVTPDQVPDQMMAPTVKTATAFPARDRKLSLDWVAPANKGSAVVGFEVEQSPGGVKSFGASSKGSEFTGLTNGSSYRFRVRAKNAKGAGAWSNWSASAIPMTKPGSVSNVSIQTQLTSSGRQGHISAKWNAPASSGGDPDGIARYHVEAWANGAKVAEKRVTGTSTDFSVANGKSYHVQVRAENRAGLADSFVKSGQVTVHGLSTAPTKLRNQGPDQDKAGTVAFTTPANNGGYPVIKYLVETQGGWSKTVAAPTTAEGANTTIPVKFTSNSSSGLWVRITPITAPAGKGERKGASAQSGAVFKPFGKPGTPKNNSSSGGYREVTLKWSTSGTANGRPIEKTQIKGDASGTFGASGSKTIATSQGGIKKCIQVRSAAGGVWSDWSSNICATSKAPKVTVYFKDRSPRTPCTATCTSINFKVEGFKANTTYTWKSDITKNDQGGPSKTGTFKTNGSGRKDVGEIAVANRKQFGGSPDSVWVDGVKGTGTMSKNKN